MEQCDTKQTASNHPMFARVPVALPVVPVRQGYANCAADIHTHTVDHNVAGFVALPSLNDAPNTKPFYF